MSYSFLRSFLVSTLTLGHLLSGHLAEATEQSLPEEEKEKHVISSSSLTLPKMPEEIISHIMGFLKIDDHINLSRVSHFLNQWYHNSLPLYSLNIKTDKNYGGDFQENLKNKNPSFIKYVTAHLDDRDIGKLLAVLPKDIEYLDFYITGPGFFINSDIDRVSLDFSDLKYLRIRTAGGVNLNLGLSTKWSWDSFGSVRYLEIPCPSIDKSVSQKLPNVEMLTHSRQPTYNNLGFTNSLKKLRFLGLQNGEFTLKSAFKIGPDHPCFGDTVTRLNLSSLDVTWMRGLLNPDVISDCSSSLDSRPLNLNALFSPIFGALPNLTHVDFSQSFLFITNEESPWINRKNPQKIQELRLGGTDLDENTVIKPDGSRGPLAQLEMLQTLDLSSHSAKAKYDLSTLKTLQEFLPNLKIVFEGAQLLFQK